MNAQSPFQTFARYAWSALPMLLGIVLFIHFTHPPDEPIHVAMQRKRLEQHFIRDLTGKVL